MIELGKTGVLFTLTALAEIIGCYLPFLVLKRDRPIWYRHAESAARRVAIDPPALAISATVVGA